MITPIPPVDHDNSIALLTSLVRQSNQKTCSAKVVLVARVELRSEVTVACCCVRNADYAVCSDAARLRGLHKIT